MTSVTVILTCYNRKSKTESCIRMLSDSDLDIKYVIVNDGSTDGTGEMLEKLSSQFSIHMLHGDGSLFWSGGMRAAMDFIKEKSMESNYYLFVNDDVQCFQGAVQRAIANSHTHGSAVIVGVTQGRDGKYTYGGVRYQPYSIRFTKVGLEEECDTFNCNFVLIPKTVFFKGFHFDNHYTHAMADFDYGLQMKRAGIPIFTSDMPIGVCENNQRIGTWQDSKLKKLDRIKLKESPKGLPYKEWFYYLNKNFGLGTALLRSVTPYLKIILGK